MLITIIDKFIESQFNFLNDYISRYKLDKKNFVGYYDKIIDTINYSTIYSQINNDKNKKKISNVIEKYILYYLLLRLNISDDEKSNEPNNEKVFVEKIFNLSNDFPVLDSVAIGELVDIYLLYNTTVTLINILKKSNNKEINLSILPNNEKTVEIIQMFNDIGIETVIDFCDTSKKDGTHNIIMSLLIRKIYIKTDKKELTQIIEENDLHNAEFKYITIIEARIKEIDFASLEALFDINQRKIGFPEDYYKLIDDYKVITLGDIEENLDPEYAIQSNLLSDDRKIAYLFHKKLLIPISDEILRYNVEAEKYIEQNQETKQNYKTDTKLNYIINKIHVITDNAKNSDAKKLYYQPLYYRQAVPYNDIEEMKIMKKFADIGRVNTENVSSFIDLLSFRVYPYINYNNFAHYGFNHKHYYTTDTLRYVNFRFGSKSIENIQDKYMQWRIITHDKYKVNNQHDFNSSIVGVAFPKYINFLPYDIRCLKLKKSVNVRKYNKNGYKIAKHLLEKLITENKTFSKTPFWIFDLNTDKFSQDQYEDINTSDPLYFKKLISKMYDTIEQLTLDRILNMYNMYSPLTLHQSRQILQIISKRLVPIPIYSQKMAEINYARYFTHLPQRIETIDIRDISFPSIELIKIPTYTPPKNLKVAIINVDKKEILDVNVLDLAVCQHTISLEYIQKLREKDPTLFTKKLNEFYKRYVIDHINSDYICNSCSQNINIDKYIYQYGDLIKIFAESKIPLEEQRRYEKFTKAITSLDKIIERMGSIFNLSEYMGNNPSSVIKRRETIRNLLDILLSSQDLRAKNPTKFDNESNILKNVTGAKYSEYFAFPVENDIFVYSSRDTDKFKKMKYNTILTHIAVLMLLDINNASIIYLNPDKLINITIFEKYGLGTLDNLKLRINNSNDLVHLGNYLLLSYVVYYMSSMMIRYKIYEIDNEANQNVDLKKGVPPLDRLKIMHTIVHVLSIIVDRKVKNPDEYLYTILSTNYFIKLSTIFNIQNSTNTLKEIRYNIEKKLQNDNQLVKKLTTKEHYMHPIDGKLMAKYPISEYKSSRFFVRYFPVKPSNMFQSYTVDELNIMVRKDLIWMYKNDNSVLKLNIDILKLNEFTLPELYAIKNKYIELVRTQVEMQKNNLNRLEAKILKKQNKLNVLLNNLSNDMLPFNEILDDFINKMEKYINESQSIYIEDFYLRKSVFIIDHDLAGFPTKPVKIDKITIKYKDSITNKDVIVYRDKNVERYYDIYTLAYLGYKDTNTNFVEVKNSRYLIIKHSLLDKIKYIGLYNKYVNILPLDKKLLYESKNRGDIIYTNKELVNQLLQNKISQDKILIEKFQRIIFSIRNNVSNKNRNPEKTEVTKEKKLIDEFSIRLQNLKILNDDFVLFLQNWKNVCASYKFTIDENISKNLIDKDNNKYIDSDAIMNNNKYNILIKYLLLELINLIEMNTDKTNINLCSLISMVFDLMWQDYSIKNNYEINTFLLILYSTSEEIINSSISIEDPTDKIVTQEKENMTEEQIQKVDDEQQDFIEEAEALDVEPMDDDERDLGDDTLATMMHDAENSDNI